VIFTSDNGTTFDIGGVDRKFFNSLGALRGYKTQLYEGGIKVPFIIRWPGTVQPGSITDHLSANWDVLPTISDIINEDIPNDLDGISFLPTLVGHDDQMEHEYLYWEYHQRWDGAQAVRMNHWKAVRLGVGAKDQGSIELYNLSEDISESNDVAHSHPEVVEKIRAIMKNRTESHIEEWNFNGNQL
jgi:arylsulfatase A-like enzyme